MEVLECKVCFEKYEAVWRKPRSFSCGHSYCSICIEDMIIKGMDCCPGCRRPHKATSVADLPINYCILDLLEVLENKNYDESLPLSETLVKPPQASAGVCDEHGNHMVFFCTVCSQWICRDCTIIDHQDGKGHSVITIRAALAQKKHEALRHFDSTENLREKHCSGLSNYFEQLKSGTLMLERIGEHIKRATAFALEEQDRIKKIMASGEHLKLEIVSAKQQFTEVLTYEHVNGAIARSSTCEEDYMKWMTNSSQSLMAPENRNNFLKWLMVMMCTSEAKDVKVKPVVYAMQDVKGGFRFAALKLRNGQLHLHSFTDIPAPSDAIVLPYNYVLELFDVAGALTFLELSWGDNQGGFVYIRLSEEYSKRAHNFLLLCTGVQEYTYRGLHFNNVRWLGRCGEFVECVDYEKKDSAGSEPLLEGLEYDGKLKQLIVSGTVACLNRRNINSSMFKIYTRDSPGYFDKAVFGCVETGLDVMRQAVGQKNIQSVVVRDCGVIISV